MQCISLGIYEYISFSGEVMPQTLPKLSIILGGARSGKSAFAERLVESFGLQKTYIATAQAFDDEMRVKISQHQVDRGDGWTTIEAPLDLKPALLDLPDNSIVLIDCLTLWLSNHILADNDIDAETKVLLATLDQISAPVVCVSNEVGMGLVPETALGRQFRDAQGRLNQNIAKQSDLAVFIAAGLPMVLKGQLPKGIT